MEVTNLAWGPWWSSSIPEKRVQAGARAGPEACIAAWTQTVPVTSVLDLPSTSTPVRVTITITIDQHRKKGDDHLPLVSRS